MTRHSRASLSLALLALLPFAVSRTAIAVPATQWMQSGTNLVWVPLGGPDGGQSLALTIGGGTNFAPDYVEWDLRGLTDGYDWFNPLPVTDNVPVPLDGGQYFCYVVDGNLAVTSQYFEPQNHSFACSQVAPYLDLSPTAALQPTYSSTFTVATWDAGFVGSVFRQDGGNGWEPWFRNGEQVMFDTAAQSPVSPAPDAGSYTIPQITKGLPPVDPGMVLGRVVFTPGGPAQQTISFPAMIEVGEVVEVQMINGGTSNTTIYPPAFVRIIAKYPAADNQADVIGEASVGGLQAAAGAGLAMGATDWGRISSYFINASDNFGNRSPNGITFDVSDMTMQATQFVTVAAVLRGYHEPIK